MLHYERVLVLIDLWVGMRLRTRLALTGICGTCAWVGFVFNDDIWISLTLLAGVVMAPVAFGAWRD